MASHTRPYIGLCPDCGKRCFATKRDAKAAIRQLRGRQGRPHPYKCGPWWHFGHLPYRVIAGDKTRDQIQPTRRTR